MQFTSTEVVTNLHNRLRIELYFLSSNDDIKKMWPEGAQSVDSVTKRPPTAGTNFKNSIIALVNNLATKVNNNQRSVYI